MPSLLDPLSTPDIKFLGQVWKEIGVASTRVTEQAEKGENNFLSMVQMWPYGPSDLLGVIFTKSARAVGYEMAGNLDKVYEEAQDILNYASFLLAYIALLQKEDNL